MSKFWYISHLLQSCALKLDLCAHSLVFLSYSTFIISVVIIMFGSCNEVKLDLVAAGIDDICTSMADIDMVHVT